MSLRDDIAGDFSSVCDDLESAILWSRATAAELVTCDHCKRSLSRDAEEATKSLGFMVSSLVKWQIDNADLTGVDVKLGDWLVPKDPEGTRERYVVIKIFNSRMTNRTRLTAVNLEEILDTTVKITGRQLPSETGAPSSKTIVLFDKVPARVWLLDQGGSDPDGDDLRPRYRCTFFADGRQVRLPLPQGCGVVDSAGVEYDVTGASGHDGLAGLVVCDLAPIRKE